MTAKSPHDKHTNDPGASASPRTLMEWLAKKFPGFFHTSPCPEDMSGFFEALEDEKLRESIGYYIQFVAPHGGLMYGVIRRVENNYNPPATLAVEETVVDRFGRITTTGMQLSVEKADIKLGPMTPEEFNTNICKPVRNMMTPDEKMAERFDKLKASDRKKAVRATAESILVQLSHHYILNELPVPGLSDRLVREAYKKAEEIHTGLDHIEALQSIKDMGDIAGGLDVKPTIPRPVGEHDVVMPLPELPPNTVFLSTPGGIGKVEK